MNRKSPEAVFDLTPRDLTRWACGNWWLRKVWSQQSTSGTFRAARNLRKQGVPLTMARYVLANRTIRGSVV